ncbi:MULTISPECIES: DNA topoisomerase III [Aneurinibacillus]|uniref:DNA topoisomerase n=1 Tax=Aneurinibacillus thermoaerophilus TaxID=143495 RepID=A0A1G7YYW7_ANETH|nr:MULTISPECIES: DNA topoisomerase III [Aneurinibacillus]AMA73143.1 DNA topoisomerase III [Aneurinibacillus sp. XH2]MED0674440.1 DNA topoisomerase III [Aneurinibacillus thermoaerophilus]MED0678457.1 DNA topoisomerase III [Aneurinibacillus thermoaerophilus]MED0736019.1 DNA topoisomerase III [Aneurinibacillus thermoaerophilus]MED0756166.1 DNA topoisomerase III [Aneurinibacillus thermoaerophilus]
MKTLVLAEKPSVGKDIARVLGCNQKHKNYMEGPKYIVTWALGHLVELAEPEDYDPKYKTWKLEDLPILPERMRLKIIRETSHQFRAISQLAKRKDIKDLIIATDAGREGELVARWIMEMIKWKKPFKRLWISSQTDKAIREGFANAKPGSVYDSLYESAVCRAEADWLIGLNVTRALTTKYNAQLAAGRVQTPTLAMIIQREEEIRKFKPTEYWTLTVDFGAFSGMWRSGMNQNSRIFKKEAAQAIDQKVSGQTGKVIRVKTSEKTEPQPLAYDLTELQRDANKRYGFSAKHTANVLQRLYEHHKLVTYPRTDSRYLTTDMVPTLKSRLESIEVGPYAQLVRPLLKQKSLRITKRIVDDSKVTDHHAIIPTEEPVRLNDLTNDERKLYDLIVRRFIALFYPPHRYESVQITIDVTGEEFYATGKTVKDTGWKEVYGKDSSSSNEDREEDEPAEQMLPSLHEGDSVTVKHSAIHSHLTKPPLRYTESDLLARMEKNNLGTPATRADIIEKLLNIDTIERQGNRLLPTKKGLQLIELVANELRSPELTAKWERQLENIARGKGDAKHFLSGIRRQAAALVKEITQSDVEYKPHNVTGSKCPECGQNLREIKGKRGKMLVCPDRECGYRRSAEKQLSNKRCPQCHKKMEIRTGKAGKFLQCKACNVIEMLEDKKGAQMNKRQERALLKKYSSSEGLTANLGEMLKAALESSKE